MSGGVDSTVATRLLLNNGFAVHGLFMNLGQPDFSDQLEKLHVICRKLGVMFTVVDVQELFQETVIDYFCTSYFARRTPNPCVICNPVVKCGELIKQARLLGCESLATGHYVRKVQTDTGWLLGRGIDGKKDQSYFLCGLQQEQLDFLQFPLGEIEKETVYEIAETFGFHDFRGKESQDVCFLKNQTVQDFLAEHAESKSQPGQIVDTAGKVLGHHAGIENYTIGQRKGLGISAQAPLYVVDLDGQQNQVIVGPAAELFQQTLKVCEMNWLSGVESLLPANFLVKIRYRHNGAIARIEKDQDGYLFSFMELQRAITPGQFAALYQNDLLIGGGAIQAVGVKRRE